MNRLDSILIGVVAMAAAGSLHAGELTDSLASGRNLGEVVVTGTASQVAANLLPYTVTVVGPKQLEASGHTQVLSVLSGMVPSLFVTERSVFGFGVSSSGGSGHIKLRGVGGDRASGVLMMVDGQPQFAGIYSHHVADFYSKETVERVEVLRGPGSVLYGSNAMAGTINIITRNPGKDGVRTTLASQYGSYNTWLTTASNSVRLGRFSSFVSASYNRTDGTVKGFDFKQAEGYAKVSYDLTAQWKATADYTLMNLCGHDPIYPTLSDPASTAVYSQNITRGEASLTASNSYSHGGLTGAVRAYYSYGNHYVDDPRHFHSTDNRFGVIVYESFRPWRGADATVGFDFDTYTGRIPMSGGTAHTPGSLSTMSAKSVTEYSPYVTLRQTFLTNLLNINAGLRMANSDKFSTQWVPQGGVAVNPGSGWTVKGNVALGYRNPSFRELYLYRMANPELQPEKMVNYEVSVGKSFSRMLAIDLTGYFSRGTNMIQTVDMKNQNTGRFINKGIEVAARSHPFDNLEIFATYSFLHTSLSNLAGAPRHQYYLGVDWTPLMPLHVSADLKGVAGLFVASGIRRQNYALLNMKVTYDVISCLSVFLRIENITDARYVINRGYPMPGFTAMGGFRVTL